MKHVVRTLITAVLVVGFLALATLLNLLPIVPHSTRGWIAFFFLGIPFYVLLEVVGEWFAEKISLKRLSRFSRVTCGVALCLVLFVLLYFPGRFVLELIQS